MAAPVRWTPATVFLGLWLLFGLWVTGEFTYYAIFDDKDDLLIHVVVALLGTFPLIAVWLEWKKKPFAWGCLTICGALVILYGASLILSVGEEFGSGFFRISIGLVLFGTASIAVQIIDWSFYR